MIPSADLFQFTPSDAPGVARITVDPSRRAPGTISPYLFGKFCEHLGANIYQGMEAQILANPTFARWVFNGGTDRANGGMDAEHDAVRIAQLSATRVRRLGLPDGMLAAGGPSLADEYQDGLAYGWFRLGGREQVRVSADVGPHGDRAQRIEILDSDAPLGMAQHTCLPLHRTRGFEFHLVARAAAPVTLTLSLAPADPAGRPGPALATATVAGGPEWSTIDGRLDIPAGAALGPAGLYALSITASGPANVVIDRLLLYPDDHIGHLDPEIIEMQKSIRLPLLRWPGGNFVSGYRWRPGVGPVDARPTLPNPAWESLEYNLFGTDEFIAFCRAVGCEPMICLNAGDGTPQEGADWVEYCNGAADTPMGRLRAANGHPEPYGVRLWEIGNELDGRHQVGWTTAGGYADRYPQFVQAMRRVDPSLRILACGSHVRINTEWNTELIEHNPDVVTTITHHVLNGGSVDESTDRVALYHSFMGYAQPLGARYRELLAQMAEAGIAEPRLAITELQLFAHFQGPAGIGAALSPATMPTNQTISEALYVATILHECIRMGDAMELVTHSATVNHGGGLRKTHERTWANPIHYAHGMLGDLRDGTALAVAIQAAEYDVPQSFGNDVMPLLAGVSAVDAIAALSPDGSRLVVSLVHRCATCGPLEVQIDAGMNAQARAEVLMLSGETWWDANSESEPERIIPRRSEIAVDNGRATLTLPPYTLAQVVFRV